MFCKEETCQNYKKKYLIDNPDCILQFADLIKLHHYHFQTELNEKASYILHLEKKILILNQDSQTEINKKASYILHLENKILILNQEMDHLKLNQSTIAIPAKRKKRSNSSETPDSTILSTSKIFPRAILNIDDNQNTTDDLNIALNSDVTFEDSCDVFMSPAKSINVLQTPKKEINTPPEPKRHPLSPINNKESVNGTPVKKIFKQKRNKTPVKLTPTKISQYLPKRIITKETPSGKKINAENEKVIESGKLTTSATTTNWLTSTDMKKKGLSLNKGLGFIQPVKHEQNNSLDNSCESIASSQTIVSKASSRKDRNILSLKTNPKMRQAKLEFDRKKMDIHGTTQIADDTKLNSTVCDEIVCASPSNVGKTKNSTQKSLRKLSRKNSDDELFNISMKKSTSTTSTASGIKFEPAANTSTPEMGKITNIKGEPETIKKPHITNLFPSTKIDSNKPLITDDSIDNFSFESELFKNDQKDVNKDKLNTSGKNSNSSSLVILPSQPDDVIIVEETEKNVDFANIDSDDLFNDIMGKGNQTPAFLKQIEKEQFLKNTISNKKNFKSHIKNDIKLENQLESDGDITQLNTLDQEHLLQQELKEKHTKKVNKSPPLVKIPITLNSIGHNCDCRNCNAYLRYLIQLNTPRDEIKIKMKQNTKHAERPLKLHLTPEGFWDPIMRDFPPGDPRNEVIIDRRFVDKNKEIEKEN